MADVIRKATNKFTKGLIMDFSPENTRNEVLTHALNATLLTFNGNELSLQNDMGNARVETAYLPDGYMPVGTCEYGGIIYIVSYNPLEDKSLIGCFPSPERNISSKELGISDIKIQRSNFQNFIDGKPDPEGTILHNTQYVLLKNDNLNPGDKFLVCADKLIYNERLSDLFVDRDSKHFTDLKLDPNDFEPISNPIIALNVVSIEESGKIVYLNSEIKQYQEPNTYSKDGVTYTDTYKYHILGKMAENNGVYDLATVDPDSYRDVLNSGYSVFKSKTSGKLAILAELIMIDSYSVTHSLQPKTNENGELLEGAFDIVIHTEITPEITESNYNTIPKLQYYYLSNSLGYVQVSDSIKGNTTRSLFLEDKDTGKVTRTYNTTFQNTRLDEIYVPTTDEPLKLNVTLNKSGKFNFPKPYTYHGRMLSYDGDMYGTANDSVYTKFIEGKYHRIAYSLISENCDYYTKDVQAKFYYYDSTGQIHQKYEEKEINETFTYYIRKDNHIYHDALRNLEHQDKILYKLVTLPVTAEKEEIENIEIEKFQYQEVHSYVEATEEDKEDGTKLYYKGSDNQTYIQLTGTPDPNVTYYVLKIELNLVSIGFEVDEETVSGTIYYFPSSKTYEEASQEDIDKYYDFITYPNDCPITLYWREEQWEFIAATEEEINNYLDYGSELYYSTDYILVTRIDLYNLDNLLFIVVPMDTFIDSTKFVPNQNVNYIEGKDKPDGDYPKDDPISLYTLADFIPENVDPEATEEENKRFLKYNDVKLASITLPSVVYINGLDLPFKYDYTIVPCMNYGKLLHLAVSNTVDFSKLHAFNQSKFNTWKYRIDDNLLRLTFGADVYDTYEQNKVDGLVLEFYDCWGFAGSVEIIDKKSYSGIFTKIIPLNSLRTLSLKKITANGYTETFKRNINIKESYDKEGNFINYVYNELPVSYTSSTEGWSSISDKNNDCGTLYSNIVYGVKAYLRRSTENGKEFIHKNNFFLYTLPIYNDFYYTVNDFNNLTNPLLDLMLTYKIKDSSSKVAYAQEGIENGYTPEDKKMISEYLGGFSDKSSIDVIKYYKYTGTSDLYLEVGLKKEYEDLNISYHPDINKYFTCNLWLLSDDSETKTFTVNSGVDGLVGDSQVLNYSNGEVTINESEANKLGFDLGYTNKKIVLKNNFKDSNFITFEGLKPIQINYLFIVGYTANITDIRNTQVLATTVCALCHKKTDGEYNYEDFGVYVLDIEGESKFLSSIMFYNEGTAEKEVFGLCRLYSLLGNMIEQCLDITSVETDALEIKTAGKLNTGDALRLLVGHLGKLTFCQPHAHGLSETNGVNVDGGSQGNQYGIPPEYGGWEISGDGWLGTADEDDCFGIVPQAYLFNNPKYNLSLNTKNSINYNSEFLSTMDFNIITGEILGWDLDEDNEHTWGGNVSMREFKGFTGEELATFNQKMIETMKHVYAYNPDYDSLTVNVGNITLQNYNPYFTSNLLSENAKFEFENNLTLNDFIYIGPIEFALYLKNLKKYSLSIDTTFIEVESTDSSNVTHFLPQVQLVPNYDYCGTPENYYLISSLTYNTPVPRELESELEFSSSNLTVIKHENGENTFLQGVPNKKVLYGYNSEFDKMIQLDVSNYTIDDSGVLKVSNESAREEKEEELEFTLDVYLTVFDETYLFNKEFTNLDGKTTNLTLGLNVNVYSSDYSLHPIKYGDSGFILGAERSTQTYDKTGNITINPYLRVMNYDTKLDYNYKIELTSIEFEYSGTLLNDELSLYGGNISLNNQTYQTLSDLISSSYKSVTLINSSGVEVLGYNSWYRVNSDEMSNRVMLQNNNTNLYEDLLQEIPLENSKCTLNYEYYVNSYTDPYNPGNSYGYDGLYLILAFDIRIKRINYKIILTSKLETSPETFLKSTKTSEYSNIENSKYVVDGKYKKARLRGSSITINDLVYEPNIEGHRLFIKNNTCVYNSYLRGKLYYRFLNGGTELHDSWRYGDTKYLNSLFLYTGPCFTEDNLIFNLNIDG